MTSCACGAAKIMHFRSVVLFEEAPQGDPARLVSVSQRPSGFHSLLRTGSVLLRATRPVPHLVDRPPSLQPGCPSKVAKLLSFLAYSEWCPLHAHKETPLQLHISVRAIRNCISSRVVGTCWKQCADINLRKYKMFDNV